MTGKELHRLNKVVEHFRQRAKEWGDDRDRETNQISRATSDGKETAYRMAGDDLEKVLEDMNS